MCTTAEEYVNTGRTSLVENRIHLPNGQPVPYDGTRRGIQASIDIWLATQQPTAQAHTAFVCEPPPSAHIEEITESHIFQVVTPVVHAPKPENEPQDIFEVFMAERQKQEKVAKPPEPAESISTPPPPADANMHAQHNPQYRYQANIEDHRLVSKLHTWLMEGKLSQTTPAHVLAASLGIRKELVDKLKVRHIETNSYEELHKELENEDTPLPFSVLQLSAWREPAFSLPLQEIDISLGINLLEPGVLDPGSQIVVIQHDLAQELGARINTGRLLEMEGANGATNWTLGCAEYLTMQVGDVPFKIHAHVIKDAPFCLLLG